MPPPGRHRRIGEVAKAFSWLGLTSFGGPIAHLGYFHTEFVERRRWLDDDRFGRLLALCQFLPGPTSSQLGFAIGLQRAGWLGALTAFACFTLPSAIMMVAFASLSVHLAGGQGQAILHGLKLVAVAVVAHGVVALARTLTPDAPRRALALAATVAALLASGNAGFQLALVLAGALLGRWLVRSVPSPSAVTFDLRNGHRLGAAWLVAFGALLLVSVFIAPGLSPRLQVAGAFYRAGALVFGGGHVVLPLLEQSVVTPGWISRDTFLAGYGAAQAVPGPMFSLAAFLGERLPNDQGGLAGAAIALAAIFLPGFLLVAGVLPFWRTVGRDPRAQQALAGVNAVVVGLLAAALYDPVCTGAIGDVADVLIALAAFVLLVLRRRPAWVVLLFCLAASLAKTLAI